MVRLFEDGRFGISELAACRTCVGGLLGGYEGLIREAAWNNTAVLLQWGIE